MWQWTTWCSSSAANMERFGHCAFTSTEILAAFGALPQ
jgi:hypothetical protein